MTFDFSKFSFIQNQEYNLGYTLCQKAQKKQKRNETSDREKHVWHIKNQALQETNHINPIISGSTEVMCGSVAQLFLSPKQPKYRLLYRKTSRNYTIPKFYIASQQHHYCTVQPLEEVRPEQLLMFAGEFAEIHVFTYWICDPGMHSQNILLAFDAITNQYFLQKIDYGRACFSRFFWPTQKKTSEDRYQEHYHEKYPINAYDLSRLPLSDAIQHFHNFYPSKIPSTDRHTLQRIEHHYPYPAYKRKTTIYQHAHNETQHLLGNHSYTEKKWFAIFKILAFIPFVKEIIHHSVAELLFIKDISEDDKAELLKNIRRIEEYLWFRAMQLKFASRQIPEFRRYFYKNFTQWHTEIQAQFTAYHNAYPKVFNHRFEAHQITLRQRITDLQGFFS